MNKVKYGLIIAAGKQSRFKKDTPKALITINGKCLLDITIDHLNNFCEQVFVVCSNENEHFFSNSYNKIVIESGLGSGDAIYKAIKCLEYTSNDRVFIQWGDSIINKDLYSYLLEIEDDKCLIPCVKEENPYVEIVQVTNNNICALFSKYGDKISSGFHDMSLFLCNIEKLYEYSSKFIKEYYDSDKKSYKHIHNNEFEFLDIFNDTNLKAHIVEIPQELKTQSFNTVEELNYILEDI